MKNLTSLFASILLMAITLMPSSIFASDYFQNQVLQLNSKETSKEVLRDIQIAEVALKSNSEKLRLAQAKVFLSQTKKEMQNRYADGSLSSYEFDDIKNELEYLAYSLNKYFANFRAFERSGNREFRNMATQNLKDANQSYARLKTITRKAARN
jgi:hypothetical protein